MGRIFSGKAPYVRPVIEDGWNLGINLAGVVDYSTQIVFKDLMKQSRFWISSSGGNWDDGYAVPYNAQGYPTSLRPAAFVRALMVWDIDGYYPGGSYTPTFDGTGTVAVTSQTSSGIILELQATNVSDPVSNIQLIIPGQTNAIAAPFYTPFVDMVSPFSTYRFMDWNSTNNSEIVSWSERTTTDYVNQTNSVAYEYMIQLCNHTQSNMWICIPQAANDDYVTQLATLIRDTLDENLICYVELSNEVWNGIFTAQGYFRDFATAAGIAGTDFQKTMRGYSRRAVQCFDIFDTVFGADRPTRVKRVLAGQTQNTGVGDLALGFENAYLKTDYYATAPYFYATGATNAMTVTQILDLLEDADNGVDYARSVMETDVGFLANNYPTVAPAFYEGGQHLTSFNTDSALDALYMAANRHPRMQTIYAAYLQAWQEVADGCLFCHYSSCGEYSNNGSWGLVEYQEAANALANSPKYQAAISGF
jgi:hypothetical protein